MVQIAEVANGEAGDDRVERCIGKRQRLGAPDDQRDAPATAVSRSREHGRGQIDRHHLGNAAAGKRQREIACARPHVERRAHIAGRCEPDRATPPGHVLPERQNTIQEVIAVRDAVEHRRDPTIVLV